ncbi:MAG: hisA/hisF family protein [Planctomycetes bacterium]|nr:hisA/hisF family protein [Planctomycetota bacterium]
MEILGVLDILDGRVVRGVGGRREEYRPVESLFCESADIPAVATAFRDHFGMSKLYVADLDAIQERRMNSDAVRLLCEAGFDIMLDAGIREIRDAHAVFDTGANAVIAGLETCAGPFEIQQLVQEFSPRRVIFSLDMRGGKPLGQLALWETPDPFEIASRAVAGGITRMIVLDLKDVGEGAGVGTMPLCRSLRAAFPDLELITGGGVRCVDDLRILADAGMDGVLVASALHNGSITAAELTAWRSEQ